MTYFKNLPMTTYELTGKTSTVKDIFKRSVFISEYTPYTDMYTDYIVKDADSIESIAEKAYGSATFHWVIAIFNEIHDINLDFAMNMYSLQLYCENKYGTDLYKTKYWVDSDNNISGEYKEYYVGFVSPENPGVEGNQEFTPITFFDYENYINDEKRKIKLLRPEFLGDFVSQYRASMNV